MQSVNFVVNHHGSKSNISVIGQEKTAVTWRLAKMNLAIRSISTVIDDQHMNKKVNFIMANPPFSLKKWREKDKLTDDYRWLGYGIPPVANANYV